MLPLGYNFWAEWELQEKVDFDGINKTIRVYPHVTTLDIREDVWSASVRWLAMLARGYDRFLEPLERTGLDAIPGGQTGDFYFLTNGWKLQIDFSKTAVTGVLFSRDFATAYYTFDGVAQFAAQVSSVVNTVTASQNIVTGDIADVPSAEEITVAVWDEDIRTLTASPLSVSQDTRITEVHGQVSREIYIDTTLVTNGNGYQQSPYNNWSDAVDGAESSGITALILMADAVVDRNIKNFLITGVGLPTIDFAGFDLKGCKLIQCKLEGLFINSIIAEKCVVLHNAWLNGWYDTCAFAGLSTCVDGAEVNVIDSTSKIAGLGRPEISMNAIGTCKLSVRGQRGGLDISNCNINSDEASIEMMAGSLTLKSSCSEGQMVIRGIGTWVNEGTTVGRLFEMVRGDHVTETHQANFNKRSWDKLNNTITIYDDDNTTVLHTFDTNSDLSNITPQ